MTTGPGTAAGGGGGDLVAVRPPRRVTTGDSAPLTTRPELVAWLRRKIADRDPVAVVRFGEGEARVLVARPDDPPSIDDAARKLQREAGLSFTPAAIAEIGDLLAFAFAEADVLGIPQDVETLSDEHRVLMDGLTALYVGRTDAGRPPARLAHCMLHQGIRADLPELLAGRAVSVVSCRDVKPALEREWGLDDVAVYRVPSQYRLRDKVDGAYEARLHNEPIWPDAHARVRAQLTVREPGEIFLVGAGMFGKDLCIRIRDQGGIAIDVGSMMDEIAGKITRGPKRKVLDLHAGGMSVPEIAAWLERSHSRSIDHGLVERVIADHAPAPWSSAGDRAPASPEPSRPAFPEWLRARIDAREPAAVVRFGDGEARLLAADLDDPESVKLAIRKLGRQSGLMFSPRAMLEVRQRLNEAFDTADVLGICYGEQLPDAHKRWMRRLAAIYAERTAAGRPPARLAGCMLNYGILGTLPELLAGRPVGAISCRDVEPALAELGIDDVAVYQVPSQYTMRNVDGAYEARLHDEPIWPDAHARVRAELTVREPGEVFLVGAGIFGKDLCIRIRDQGGIALDMGSALDRMVGKITRGGRRPAAYPAPPRPRVVPVLGEGGAA